MANVVSREQYKIGKEAKYILERAQHHDARVVAIGPLVFFSTETGDAWVLDPEDKLALCLSRDGKEQEYTIEETATNFGVGWKARYQIENGKFIVYYDTGEKRTIIGYPVEKIVAMSTYSQNS